MATLEEEYKRLKTTMEILDLSRKKGTELNFYEKTNIMDFLEKQEKYMLLKLKEKGEENG